MLKFAFDSNALLSKKDTISFIEADCFSRCNEDNPITFLQFPSSLINIKNLFSTFGFLISVTVISTRWVFLQILRWTVLELLKIQFGILFDLNFFADRK
jgi:hypothetical protein